jgi:DNA repair exonuclease SbcCD ATPase subunit
LIVNLCKNKISQKKIHSSFVFSLHKALMKLQIEQIESFDTWLSQIEHRISTQLEFLEQDLSGVERQYKQLGQLQDELVAQQQITESLQNMVIVIDESANNKTDDSTSKYTSAEIEAKLANLSERWANICTFVQNRWIQLQEIKIELEQVEGNLEKTSRWLTRKEEEIAKILAETDISDTNILMQQVHSIKVIQSEKRDVLVLGPSYNKWRNQEAQSTKSWLRRYL